MAAAIIPIVSVAAPVVVRLIEKLFGNGNGAVKKSTATTVLQAVESGLHAAGQAPAPAPADAVAAVVQSAVDSLNAAGVLKGTATEVAPSTALALPVDVNLQAALEGISEMLSGFVKITAALHSAK